MNLRYIPGQVVVISRQSLELRFDEHYISVYGELIETKSYELKSGGLWLHLFVVNNGEEQRFIDMVNLQPDIEAVSLNYIGLSQDVEEFNFRYFEENELYPELIYQPGAPAERVFCCMSKWNKGNIIEYDSYERLVEGVVDSSPRYIIANIDVSYTHSKKMMDFISTGYSFDDQMGDNKGVLVISLSSEIAKSNITDLYGFSDALFLLASIVGPINNIQSNILCLNMSVDFAQVISGYNQMDISKLESPGVSYSIPFFEKLLKKIIIELSQREKDADNKRTSYYNTPAVFAAAGNRQKHCANVRVRLGYPACRPETIASTLVISSDEYSSMVAPVDDVDIPATMGIKPCFSIDVNTLQISERSGSSIASAWLAGFYSCIAIRHEKEVALFGCLSKVAWLMQWTKRKTIKSSDDRLPCFVANIKRKCYNDNIKCDVDELVYNLKSKFKADFCLTGSTAAVAEWLALNKSSFSELKPWINKDVGDIDIIYSGEIVAENIEEVKDYVHNWLKNNMGRSWVLDKKRNVEIHGYEGLSTVSERLHSVVPVNKLYISSGGVIDTWGGLDDLKNKKIRFFPLINQLHWRQNHLYCTGADSLALNILQWFSIIVLLNLVSNSIDVEGLSPEEDSLEVVEKIINYAEKKNSDILMSSTKYNDIRERLDRRFDRLDVLMGTCAKIGIVNNEIETLFNRLEMLTRR